jgi:hypothetical protein
VKVRNFPNNKREGTGAFGVFKQNTPYNRAESVTLNAVTRRELQYSRSGTGNSKSDTYYMQYVEDSIMALRW